MLEVREVSIRFGAQPEAVSDVSLTVREKEKLAIIGETGSGKSVLLLAILRLLPHSARVTGAIRFAGKDLLTCSKKELNAVRGRHIAYIPQGSGNGLNPLYTVGHQIKENLWKFKRQRGKPAAAEARRLLEQFGMDDPERVLRAYPFMLSGGMRQRALIAMGIAGGTELLLADEPTKGLDVRRIDMVIDAFSRLHGQTILCVTHDLRFAKAVASRVIVMYASQQIESGDKEAFFAQPLHPYSQAMLQALPENGLEASMGFAPPRADEEAGKGCHYMERCPYRTERCQAMPPMISIEGREVRCWKYADGDA